MTYAFQDDRIGLPPISAVGAAQAGGCYPGMLAHAVDPVQGGGEFVYLPGVANTVQGSVVTYNQKTPATTLAATGAPSAAPVAVAMAAIGAGQWGWYQVSGNAMVAKTTAAAIAAGAALALTATAGAVTTSAGGGAAGSLDSAVCSVAALAADTLVNATLSRPMVN